VVGPCTSRRRLKSEWFGRPLSSIRCGLREYVSTNDPLPWPDQLADKKSGHTIGFEPNAFVDVTLGWSQAMEWLGRLMAFVLDRPYDPKSPDAAQAAKESLARYRGLACGVKYAEAVWAPDVRPCEIL
jgi:hypothetical protein